MKFQFKHTKSFPVRLSFPQIWRAAAVQTAPGEPEGKKSFSGNILILPDDPQIQAFLQLIAKVAAEKWESKAEGILAGLYAKDRVCIHNGDFKADYDGYPGHWYLTARSPTKPLILGRSKETLEESSGRPFGGCYVNFSVDVYAQDNNWGQRINATLRGIQYVEDGDAFAAGPPATPEEFDDLGVDESASVQM
jgi:hypothetical protein